MEHVEKFLNEAQTYYLATMEGDQPRVRPFGTIHIFEGKLYIQTGKKMYPSSFTGILKQKSVHLRTENGCEFPENW